ncbi:MAG: phosphate-starvation-inducible PsiE family protein [Deltaproteobacteria bacterium]
MAVTIPGSRFIERFEKGVAFYLICFLSLLLVILLLLLTYLFTIRLGEALPSLRTVSDMQEAVQRSFSGIFLILLGLELLETVKVYFTRHQIRAETILIVALIASGRHVLIIDLHHTDASTLYGIAALIMVLSGSYFLVRKGRVLGELSQRKDGG